MPDPHDPSSSSDTPLTGEILPGRSHVRVAHVTGWPAALVGCLVLTGGLLWFLVLPVIGLLTVLGWLL